MQSFYKFLFYLFFTTTCLPFSTTFSIADWIWGQKGGSGLQGFDFASKNVDAENIELPAEVPFETLTVDERFLQEAQYFGLTLASPLEKCQQSIVFNLKTSCSSLTEEQLGKISVALLNCQLVYEGRPEFKCTDEMRLRRCTEGMDPETWNTYHLMNNRARSLCVAARTSQFNALTEMTINKLMASTKGHIDSLQALKAEQEKLGITTDEIVHKLEEEQNAFLQKQLMLKKLQMQTELFVQNRLRDLAYERSLLVSLQRQLTATANLVTQKLYDANDEIDKRNTEWKFHQDLLAADVKKLHERVAEIWKEIDQGTKKMKNQLESTMHLNAATLQSLQVINASVIYFQNLFSTTHNEINMRLNTFVEILGGSDTYITSLIHLCFLLISMLLIAFIGAPYCTKVLLVVLTANNIFLLTTNGAEAAIPLPATTFLIIFGSLLHKIFMLLLSLRPKLPSQPQQNLTKLQWYLKLKNNAWGKLAPFIGAGKKETTAQRVDDSDEMSSESDSGLAEETDNLPSIINRESNLVRRGSVYSRRSRNSTPSRSGTPTRPLCSARCVNGQPCRMFANTLQGTCARHSS
ncbi:protein brambleberry-like isoform X2 [Neocloeon triangulifer]|uniref:protein brambleberry-like isoform X2 n=1 Tax=Neocloeon triangulifer TaxID=2078957 RepID=UPI00286FA9D8|nr:protein brambleberry-like isoform X2 [Neocloeon triangulifer]